MTPLFVEAVQGLCSKNPSQVRVTVNQVLQCRKLIRHIACGGELSITGFEPLRFSSSNQVGQGQVF